MRICITRRWLQMLKFPDRRILFTFFETFFWFVWLLACLLACLFVCLFDMLSFLSEAQFAYGPRAPRQSGYSGFGAVTGTAKRGLRRPAYSFTESSNEISGVQACRPVPTSGTGRKRFQVGMMIDNHLIYPTAPDMRLEAERQPRGSSKRKLHLLACLLLAWTLGRSP